MPANLSVNVNKIALLRNSRGGPIPDLVRFARLAIEAGAQGITVHPREDARHVTLDDVLALAEMPEIRDGRVEFNIEGNIRPELVRLTRRVRPTQFTVVPATPGELTSERGWRAYDDQEQLAALVAALKGSVRISVFTDADPRSVALAAEAGVDAVEFYTGAYAAAFDIPAERDRHLAALGDAAALARSHGLRIHCGHDLDPDNLPPLLSVMRPDELSIGHRLVSEAIERGLATTVRRYLDVIAAA